MRYLVVLLLLVGCASSRPPQGGWVKPNSQPGELERDWRECYGDSQALGLGKLMRQMGGEQSAECMRARGWM